MLMTRSDITVLGIDEADQSLHVGASAGTVGMTWPPTVTYGGDVWRYKCNEVLTDDLLKHFGGHAKYIRAEAQPR